MHQERSPEIARFQTVNLISTAKYQRRNEANSCRWGLVKRSAVIFQRFLVFYNALFFIVSARIEFRGRSCLPLSLSRLRRFPTMFINFNHKRKRISSAQAPNEAASHSRALSEPVNATYRQPLYSVGRHCLLVSTSRQPRQIFYIMIQKWQYQSSLAENRAGKNDLHTSEMQKEKQKSEMLK